MDEEGQKPRVRPWIDKGVLVSYTFENGSCCMGQGIVSRAYHVLEEYTVLLRDGSKEEVKTERWNRRKPAKKKDENSEYHNIEFRYFSPRELTVLSGLRPGDVVEAHFAVKKKGAAEDELIKSRRTELAVVINTTVPEAEVSGETFPVASVFRDWMKGFRGSCLAAGVSMLLETGRRKHGGSLVLSYTVNNFPRSGIVHLPYHYCFLYTVCHACS
ncbi:unnamed protein product [Symbiodinium necroappetens]|uniref:Uncharacterized protein n=1 Tax=Symbiodinium necroappetens TaxID=1628268 RepID=A0A812LVW6_9DINO|nr:unnamed protein product [Symbiodinium necroappetens]